MTAASFRTICGIAKETTSGTPVAASSFIPVTSMKNDLKTTYLADEGMRGSMVAAYDQLVGPQEGVIDLGGNVYADTLGFLLQSLLPDLVVTGSSAPYTSVFSAKNTSDGQPTTYTVTDYDGVMTRQFPGTKLSELTLKWTADGLLTFAAKGSSLAPVTTSAPTPSFSAVRANAAWASTLTVGGTVRATSNIPLDIELSFKRKVEVVNAIDGTASPSFIWSGPLDVTGKVTTIFSDTTDYLNMVNNSQPAVVVGFTTGSGATLTALSVQMSQAAFTAATPDRGKDYVTLAIDLAARANTTDIGASGGYSPAKVTLQNAIASGTYA